MSGSEEHPNSKPPQFLADEKLEKAIVDGVKRRRPGITFELLAEKVRFDCPTKKYCFVRKNLI